MKTIKSILNGLALASLLAITQTGFSQTAVSVQNSFSGINLTAAPVQAVPIAVSVEELPSLRKLTDAQLGVFLDALDVTPQIPCASLPRNGQLGNFFSLQHPEWPPIPIDTSHSPVWQMNDFYLMNDLTYDYDAADAISLATGPQRRMSTAADDGLSPPFLGGGGGGGNYSPDDSPQTIIDYSTNLWIAQVSLASGYLTGIGTNTLADVQYEIQSRTNLTQTDWQSEGFIFGSELTNWTPLSVPQNNRTNLFIRLKSWGSSDGSGLPDWWELQYFGTTGVDPYGDPAGDGYNNLQKFQNGMNPNIFYTPAAPQDFSASYNPNTGAVVLNWLPAAGPVTGYSLQKVDYQSGQNTNVTLAANSTAYPDSIAGDTPRFNGPLLYVEYSIQAQYGTNGISASAIASLEDATAPQATILTGPQGQLSLVIQNPPSDLSNIRIYRQQGSSALDIVAIIGAYAEYGSYGGIQSPLSDGYFTIPASSITNGTCQIPATQAPSFYNYGLWVQTVRSNGIASGWAKLADPFTPVANTLFVDARQQLKDNLRFLLRGANGSPVTFQVFGNGGSSWNYTWPSDYVYAGFYASGDPGDHENNYGTYNFQFDGLRPIHENCFYRNFAFDAGNLAANGLLNTGCYSENFLDYEAYGIGWFYNQYPIDITNYPTYYFDVGRFLTNAGATVPPSQLSPAQTQWILPPYGGPMDFGNVLFTGNPVPTGQVNCYGLPLISEKFAYVTNSGIILTTCYPGGAAPSSGIGVVYSETAQPSFALSNYYFARLNQDPMPEMSDFATTNTTPLLIQGVGTSQQFAGYAKLSLQNGYSGVYGYLGQYFDQAYKIDASGNVTTSATGILSPAGNFFATEPGPAALVTMPDIDTGQRGTCTVYSVSLQLDANHDGQMDLSFNGPDATSASSPYVFWRNNNFDRSLFDSDDGTNYDDDAPRNSYATTGANSQGNPIPDYDYTSYQYNPVGGRAIPTQRDLEDYARLWICGITTNLLAALPPGSTLTLSWGDLAYPNPSNPTVDLFTSVEADGGIGYLTNGTLASIQVQAAQGQANNAYVGRLGPGQSIQLNTASGWLGNHFIWCGVSNGTGGLTLTIADANSNVLAQTTAYIQIQDIKQMYERWTVGDAPNKAPMAVATNAVNDLAVNSMTLPFNYDPPQNINTPYILFVHGWNMTAEDKDRFAETAFKRLYWQGYHGRFGCFRWPTDNGFTGSFWQALTDTRNFDYSEYQAWQSAQGLLNKLTDLNSEYPGHVYMLAHSMGNVVAGEALRLAGNNQVVNTYVASQAAISAHNYDASVTAPFLLQFTYHYPSGPLWAAGTWNYGPDTPDIYVNRLTNNIAAAGRRINFYNTNDFALAMPRWGFDQVTKPDSIPPNNFYYYSGSVNDSAPWNKFIDSPILGGAGNLVDIVTNLNNCYKIMAYAGESYSTALGATSNVHNLDGNIDLASQANQIWPSDANNYTAHFWHSAEFRGDYWQQQGYWNELLSGNGFNLK